MHVDEKLKRLVEIYRIYDETVASLPAACAEGCAHCCSRNVTLTTLEAWRMVAALDRQRLEGLYQRLEAARGLDRFRPRITINHLAELCRADADPPEDDCDPAWTPCPVLTDHRCPVYDLRPFACRGMVSAVICRPDGAAAMDGFRITVNTVFQQVIEHLDVPGATGNLVDVLLHFRDAEVRSVYRSRMIQPRALGLPANRPVKMLMIPPEDRQRLQPVVARIRDALGGEGGRR
jgi:hypothetical protein